MDRHAAPGRSTRVEGAHAAEARVSLAPGRRTLVDDGAVVQRRVRLGGEGAVPGAVHAAAARGVATPARSLPYAPSIQARSGATMSR